MKQTTKLRLFGAVILLFFLWLIGSRFITGTPALLLVFGFAAAYEFFVVRPASKADKE